MLSKVKVWLGAMAVAVIAILSGMVAIARNQRDKAEAERETAETNLTKAVEANETHQKVEEVKSAIQEKKDEVASASNSDIDDGMLKYDRSRNQD